MKLIKNLISGYFSLMYPRHCLVCNAVIENQKSWLCQECWFKLPVIGASQCEKCGAPLGKYAMPAEDCSYCKGALEGLRRVVAIMYYIEEARDLILELKFRRQVLNGYCLGEFLASHLKTEEFLSEIDFVTAVPLHWRREFTRAYNQADIIASKTSSLLKISYQPRILVRKKGTTEQATLPFEKRKSNIEGAFTINFFKRKKIRNKTILLIDDVMTTGSTLSECAITLKREGAKKIYGAVIARAGIRNASKFSQAEQEQEQETEQDCD